MLKRFPAVILAVLFLSSLWAVAQQPQPGPELKNLSFLAGNWKVTADLKPGPMGPGGKFTSTEKIEWMPGGFFLVSHTEGSGAGMGNITELAVYGYDSAKKVYTYDAYNSSGEREHYTGTFDGKVWTWSSDLEMGGQLIKTHFILTETSASSYTSKFEMSTDGTKWTTVLEGNGSK